MPQIRANFHPQAGHSDGSMPGYRSRRMRPMLETTRRRAPSGPSRPQRPMLPLLPGVVPSGKKRICGRLGGAWMVIASWPWPWRSNVSASCLSWSPLTSSKMIQPSLRAAQLGARLGLEGLQLPELQLVVLLGLGVGFGARPELLEAPRHHRPHLGDHAPETRHHRGQQGQPRLPEKQKDKLEPGRPQRQELKPEPGVQRLQRG